MCVKDEILAMNTGSGERALEMNEELRTITEKVKESDERIDDFGNTGVRRDTRVNGPSGPMLQTVVGSARRAAERAVAGGAEPAFSRYVDHFEKPLVWSIGNNTGKEFDGHVYWCVYEVNVTVENGKRWEGTACNYTIAVPEGRSLFAEMNAKVSFYDWVRVRSKSYVLEDKDISQQLDWRKSYGDPTDEIDCLNEINEFGRRIVASKDVTH